MRNSMIILMAIVAFACSGNKIPKGILTEEQITPVLVELHLAEAVYTQRFSHESTRENYQEDLYLTILKKYKLDQKVFEASVLYYGKHPDKYKPVYDEVLNRLNEMRVKSRAKDSIQAKINDSIQTKSKDTIQINVPDSVQTNINDTIQIKVPDSVSTRANDTIQIIK